MGGFRRMGETRGLKPQFKQMIEDLYLHFRFKESPKSEIMQMWYSDLSYIPYESYDNIAYEIRQEDNLPRNLPKKIKSIYSKISKKFPIYVEYNKYEDDRFPVALLEKGVEKLRKYGMHTFWEFCEEVKMPFCDRNRVISKCRHAYDIANLKEQALSEDLKEARLIYYTEKLGYSQKRALSAFKIIDMRYEKQFDPIEKGVPEI